MSNCVHLLVVTAEWIAPNGKYLACKTGDYYRLKPFLLGK